MTNAQAALAQVREAMAAGPTPGEWACYDDSSDGKTNRIEIVAIGKTVARIYRSVPEQDLPNARLIAACSPANMTAILAHVEAQAAEIERLTAERDEHAHWRRDLADKLHDRETTISAAWEALRSARVHSEATIDDGIRLLSRQLDEAEPKREPVSDDAIESAAYERAAQIVEPKSPRPCDCEVCDCGNSGDRRAVIQWDEAAMLAAAIRALGRQQ